MKNNKIILNIFNMNDYSKNNILNFIYNVKKKEKNIIY